MKKTCAKEGKNTNSEKPQQCEVHKLEILKNQSSVKLLEINEPNHDVIQRVLDRSQKMHSLTHDLKQYMKKWEEI